MGTKSETGRRNYKSATAVAQLNSVAVQTNHKEARNRQLALEVLGGLKKSKDHPKTGRFLNI